jgi:hypothetical protein
MQFSSPSLDLDSSGESACEMGWDCWTAASQILRDESNSHPTFPYG